MIKKSADNLWGGGVVKAQWGCAAGSYPDRICGVEACRWADALVGAIAGELADRLLSVSQCRGQCSTTVMGQRLLSQWVTPLTCGCEMLAVASVFPHVTAIG